MKKYVIEREISKIGTLTPQQVRARHSVAGVLHHR
jgi:hypothetical protein